MSHLKELTSLNGEFKMNKTLNPLIFDKDNKLYSKVRSKIQDVVKEFVLSLTEDEVRFPILDILIVGSNAGYNYNESSDLDVHIVTSFKTLCDSPEIISALFNAERSIFNNKYDIKFRGISVELYVEDINAATVSNGIYSVVQDDWIKFPDKSIDYDNYDKSAVNKKYMELMKEYYNVVTSNDIKVINDFIDQLYYMRKSSLSSEGELGIGNLTFKKLRSSGVLNDLRNKLARLKSKEMSI